ncbi:nitrogenase iron-molybdenum cofactor biosynthesis protein NifN [Sessilibacter corallicola]|uniref:nitrogenase iron-molybdenum cofactor biosynthesis protein NifN n=1 Tax=Sessilibacter corallicola TaxID=2904075 RepID=UPI001E496467|nr:nitrogenase iron-molybdenum cofactor biosynthesis protein NifN [Sessilibacter corallicola]MCE2029642.1 nitrogenase iron-molybdenum cofactor biosynthesis protein NifN [Sessilibacter corallicola]
MAELVKRNKALSVSPLKTSQTIGGALAFLGLNRAMPLMHGSQGCTAFAKVFFVRHFREPIPLQTTAMDQVSSVMGADENIIEALKTIAEKNKPEIIGLVTTGLAETQGCDINAALKTFRKKYPDFSEVEVVCVNTPDFSGSFESGFALALKSIVEALVPVDHTKVGLRKKQVNVLCGGNLTPGDLEFVCESIESFGLRPMLIPDLSGSLDGHLERTEFSALTTGGTGLNDIRQAGENAATLVIGHSLLGAADSLLERTHVPDFRFGHLMGQEECDRWFMTLSEISEQPVPEKWRRQRSQLQDAMLDTHFMIGDAKVAIASDPDLLLGFDALLTSMGATTVAAVVPAKMALKNPALESVNIERVKIGDLEDAEQLAKEGGAELFLGNSHAVESAERLGIPILRIGFPQYDLVGGFQRCWFGYRGTQQTLFDLANLLQNHHRGMQPYHSPLAQKRDDVA